MKIHIIIIAVILLTSLVQGKILYKMWLYPSEDCSGSKKDSIKFKVKEKTKGKDDKYYRIELGKEKFQFDKCDDDKVENCEELTTFELGDCKPLSIITDSEKTELKRLMAKDDWGDTNSFEFSPGFVSKLSFLLVFLSLAFYLY
ncbi:hypothetical protein M0813_02392 [Anaeramoeba flamelloides]|uniref:Uncharacterized protein n=1 Tax=Anaeramoeba flamelloides TaxID=1746091 RepID=A0ABQ8YIK9_9EUKA|nr:hypothetical protein M0813_02392 [Anaeramoeba flamelloides]